MIRIKKLLLPLVPLLGLVSSPSAHAISAPSNCEGQSPMVPIEDLVVKDQTSSFEQLLNDCQFDGVEILKKEYAQLKQQSQSNLTMESWVPTLTWFYLYIMHPLAFYKQLLSIPVEWTSKIRDLSGKLNQLDAVDKKAIACQGLQQLVVLGIDGLLTRSSNLGKVEKAFKILENQINQLINKKAKFKTLLDQLKKKGQIENKHYLILSQIHHGAKVEDLVFDERNLRTHAQRHVQELNLKESNVRAYQDVATEFWRKGCTENCLQFKFQIKDSSPRLMRFNVETGEVMGVDMNGHFITYYRVNQADESKRFWSFLETSSRILERK